MFKKKKINQKQTVNQLHQRHVLPLNLPSFSAQESRIKTLPSAELKAFSKTIDLHKDTLAFKKNISRKTTSRTIKMEQSLRPSHLNNILKNIKSIRSNAYNEISKSKSPAGPKSKSTKKLCPKNKSDNRLSLKIDSTLRKMNLCEIFVDQQSNVVFPSASTRPHLKHNLSNLSELDDIDIQQIKRFRTAAEPQERLKVEIKSGDSLQETVAAITIQRAWRNYKTKQLVQRYAQNNFSYLFGSNHSISSGGDPFAKLSTLRQELVIVPSDDFYGQTVEEDVRQISNLQDSSPSLKMDPIEEKVKSIKLQQLQKWNDILTMIQATKNTTQEERQRIFSEIARQSERNRQQLIELTDHNRSQRKQIEKKDLLDDISSNRLETHPINQQQIKKEQNTQSKLQELDAMDSGQRVKMQSDSQSDSGNYNANKYIEYLNVDAFPDPNQNTSSQRGRLGISTISNREKEALLQSLKARPVKLPYDRHSSALSLINLHDITPRQEHQSAKPHKNLRRSTSERVLRRTLSEISSFQQEDNVNLEILEEEYLQNYPILIEDNEQNSYEVHLSPDFSGELRQQQKLDSPDTILKKEKSLHNQFQELFDNLVKLQKQDHNESISSEETLKNNQQHQERADHLATILLNTLAMEVLHDVARSKILTAAIKQFSNHSKPKVRRTSEGQKKKKGFPTDKKQIDLFLHNFTSFIIREEFSILKNLQISTGPSALEMLRYMHTEDQDSLEERSESQEPNIMVIPNRIFDAFWKIKEKSIIVEVPSDFTEEHSAVFRQNIEYLKSFNKIFYRSLFDTFNQCLDHERNYGILGKPFPWKKTSNFQHTLSDQAKKQSLQRAQSKMVSYATTYCGLIIDAQEVGSTVGNEQYLQQVQQDRLSRMLASDLLESEARWQFYDDEEAEILIEVSNVIYRELLFQVLELLCQFQ